MLVRNQNNKRKNLQPITVPIIEISITCRMFRNQIDSQSHKTQSDPAGWQHSRDHSAHGYGDIDAQVAIVCKQLGNRGVKHQAVGVHDGRADPLMDRSEITSGFNPTLKKTLCYLGVASQVRRRLWPFSSNLGKYMG